MIFSFLIFKEKIEIFPMNVNARRVLIVIKGEFMIV
jgi:hypothetical protein